jgi:hypothetical protein
MNTGKSQVNAGIRGGPRENRSNANAIISARNENHLGKGRRAEFIVVTSSHSERTCTALWLHNGAADELRATAARSAAASVSSIR